MKKNILLISGLACFWLCIGCLPLLAQTAPKITRIEIRHVGPPAASEALIHANIRVKEGDAYQRARVDDDVRNLYGTGFFRNIRVAEEVSDGGVVLIYVLQGNPVIHDIKFSGNKKFSNGKLQKKLTIKTGQPLDDKKVFHDSKEIEKMYQKSGFQKTTVKAVDSVDENSGRASVTFEIRESDKVKIDRITFEGIQVFSEKKLCKQMKTKRRSWLSWLTSTGILKDEQFEDDKEKVVQFCQNEGYIDFAIQDVKFDPVKPGWIAIRFVVSEGRQYKVGTVGFGGNKLYASEEFSKGMMVDGKLLRVEMGPGAVFTPKGLNKDVETIQDFYGAKGYVDTRVIAVKTPNTTTGTMDLTYEIEESIRFNVGRIDIKGNEKTKDKVIRRELAVSPGEVFDTTRVKLSKRRIEGLNYFEKVETRYESTDVKDQKNLVVGVEEKNTGSFTVGAGLSSVDSVVGFVEISQSNFDLFKAPTFSGAGQKFRMRAQVGTERQDYQISFVEPWFLNRKLALGTDLYHRDLSYVSRQDIYDETHTGGSVSLTRALGSEFLIGRATYTLESVNLDLNESPTSVDPASTNVPPDLITNVSPEIVAESGRRLVSKIGTSLAYDTRNSALYPNRGQRTEFITELAGLGGDTDFYKLELRSTWYFPGFFEGHVWEVSGRAGFADSYGDSDRVPIFDRWFLGGLYSLRGYRYREVGPKVASGPSAGEPLGGNTYVTGTVEYTIPIIERLKFALFYDIGNVYSKAFSFDAEGRKFLSDNWGAGLRINLPIGPLRLDYGVPIQHDEDTSSSGRFQFGVGYTREF